MREIKFRGKRIGDGMWIYGDLIRCDGRTYIFNNGVNPFDASSWYEVITETVGEFTGLRDKNGKEIYEGDIVEWDDNSNGEWRRRCEVRWKPAHYELVGYVYNANIENSKKTRVKFSFGSFIYEADGELEVIGNIHENPELLMKGGK